MAGWHTRDIRGAEASAWKRATPRDTHRLEIYRHLPPTNSLHRVSHCTKPCCRRCYHMHCANTHGRVSLSCATPQTFIRKKRHGELSRAFPSVVVSLMVHDLELPSPHAAVQHLGSHAESLLPFSCPKRGDRGTRSEAAWTLYVGNYTRLRLGPWGLFVALPKYSVLPDVFVSASIDLSCWSSLSVTVASICWVTVSYGIRSGPTVSLSFACFCRCVYQGTRCAIYA